MFGFEVITNMLLLTILNSIYYITTGDGGLRCPSLVFGGPGLCFWCPRWVMESQAGIFGVPSGFWGPPDPYFPQDVLYTICNPCGPVQRIVIFRKNGVQAMVEYPGVHLGILKPGTGGSPKSPNPPGPPGTCERPVAPPTHLRAQVAPPGSTPLRSQKSPNPCGYSPNSSGDF